MRSRISQAAVGVADHAGWAILITGARDGTLIDRRRVELIDPGLPSFPHHHEGQGMPIDEAVELVARVRASASRHAAACFDALAAELSVDIVGVGLRRCPPLPASVAERITNYIAQAKADSVMYRDVLAAAAQAKHWPVTWYDPDCVFSDAAKVLGRRKIDGFLKELGASIGPPWRKDHRMALSAAIAIAGRR